MTALRLTVLGGGGAYPQLERPCSGFLVEYGGVRVVLDLGYGTLPRLLALRPEADVDAVVITHEHPDHCIDLHGLARIRAYGSVPVRPLPYYGPPGVLDRLQGLEPDLRLRALFATHDLPGHHRLGPFALTGIALPHHVPNVGVRLATAAGTIAYTGDTGPAPALADLGRDVDLFVVEATDRPGEADRPVRRLLTAREAGQWATTAGARRLLLTHLWPGTDPDAAVAAAREHFTGAVEVAEPGLVVTVGG